MLHGDLGTSLKEGRPVVAVIRDALPSRSRSAARRCCFRFSSGTMVGIVQAARRGTYTDFTLTIISVVLAASPAYWLGLGAIALFTYVASSLSLPLWARLPAVGMTTPGADLHGLAHVTDLLRHSILPVTLLAAIGAAGVARYVRTSALDVLGADWVRTARAKGLPERTVLRPSPAREHACAAGHAVRA